MASNIRALLAILLALQTTAIANQDIPVSDTGLFSRLDDNADGQITAEELPASQSRLFSRMLRRGDANNDASLSQTEWQQASTPDRPAKPLEEKQSSELPGADATRLLLLKLDTNEDGVLSEQEAPAELARAYKEIADRYDRPGVRPLECASIDLNQAFSSRVINTNLDSGKRSASNS